MSLMRNALTRLFRRQDAPDTAAPVIARTTPGRKVRQQDIDWMRENLRHGRDSAPFAELHDAMSRARAETDASRKALKA